MARSTPESHVATGDHVFTLALDVQGRVTALAPSAERATGRAAHELLGCDPFDRLCGADAARVRAALLAATDGSPGECDGVVRARDEATRVVRWSSFRTPDATGAEGGYVVVAVDRSRPERPTTEGDLARDLRAHEDGALAEALAHEIRNPLNGASLHLSVLERELDRSRPPQARAHEALAVVRSELRRISAFVVDFLEFARPRPIAVAPADLNSLLHDVVARFAGDAEARCVDLRFEPATTTSVAMIDAHRVDLALAHLVENALAATLGGGHVTARVRASGEQVKIEVEDDGPGVPPSDRSIFDAFFTTKAAGTGLGLSIARRSARDHGGDVTYRCQPGSTVFTLTLPAATP